MRAPLSWLRELVDIPAGETGRDVAARLEELQTLPRTPGVMGDDFVQLVRTQIDSWRAVARAAHVEVIG